jgi:hypothetical protein
VSINSNTAVTGSLRVTSTGNFSGTLTGNSSVFTNILVNALGEGVNVVGVTGNPAYYATDQSVNNGGKRWRVGHTGAIGGFGSFDFYNQTDNITPLTLASTGAATFSGNLSVLSAAYDGGAEGLKLGYDASYYNAISATFSSAAANNKMNFVVNSGNGTRAIAMTLQGNGNVGIGTTSPSSKLSVDGDIRLQSSTAAAKSLIFSSPASNWGPQDSSIKFTPADGVNAATTLSFNLWDGLGAINERMRITSGGQVLIGQTVASGNTNGIYFRPGVESGIVVTSDVALQLSRLSTTGDIQTLYYGSTRIGKIAVGSSTVTFESATNGGITVNSSGNVSIGTSSPLQTASNRTVTTINGTSSAILNLATGDTLRGYVYVDSSGTTLESIGTLSIGTNTSSALVAYTGGTERMRINSDGNIRLFITTALDTKIEWFQTPANVVQARIWADGNPRLNVQVGGSGGVYLASGGTSWTSASDEILKNINNVIGNAIDKLNTLRAVNFSWKSDTSNKENLGLIAQDVEAVFPQIVDTDKDGLMGVRYTELIPVLVKAIQEQQSQIETLKSKIEILEQS